MDPLTQPALAHALKQRDAPRNAMAELELRVSGPKLLTWLSGGSPPSVMGGHM